MLTYAYPATREQVWAALVEPEQMRQWYFENIPDFKAALGFTTRFPVQSGDRTFTHVWEVSAVDPGKQLTYQWAYEGYPGQAFIRFSLEEQATSVQVNLYMEITKDFPDNIEEFQRDSCIQGWEYFMGQRLRDYLARLQS